MATRQCEACGETFHQFGRGRPAKRCPECRAGDRYGAAHQQLRAQTEPDAWGQPCSRCGLPMLEGQRLQLDHDDADPTRYLGWSHGRCNERAGASKGNRQRAAAYRAARGLPEPTAPRANGGVILKPAAPTGYQAKLLREARLESGVTPGTTRPLSGEWIECYHPVFGWVRQRWW